MSDVATDTAAQVGPATQRCALVGPTHPAPGGIVHFTDGLADAMKAAGPTLVVGWKRRFPEFLYPGTSRDEQSTTIVSADGEPLLDLLDPRSWATAAKRIIAFGADVAVLQWWHPMHTPVIVAMQRRFRKAGIQTLIICHNVEPHETNAMWRRLTRRALSCADALVVHAPSVADEARALVPGVPIIEAFMPTFDNVSAAMTNGIASDAAKLRRRLDAVDRPLLLTFGYVRPYKGVEDAIQSIAYCRTAPKLLVAGECWDEPDRFRELAQSSGVANQVVLDFRYIPNDELPGIFGAADVVVLPYREATQSAVAALAFAYNKPVVATRVGGLPDFVTDGVTGALADPHDPQGLAEAIDRVVTDQRDWTPAITQTRERFSWARYVDLLLTAPPQPSNTAVRDPQTHAVLDVGSRSEKAAKLLHVIERHVALNGADVLDVGTGSGTIARILGERVGPHGSATSVDVEDVRVERDGFVFHRYDGRHMPIEDASKDVVISNHVIEHVGDLSAQQLHLAEIARVLRPGGLAYVAVPHKWQLVENHYRIPLLGWLPQRFADLLVQRIRDARRFDIRALGRRELIAMMRSAGFDAHEATGELITATAVLGHGTVARVLRRLPGARALVRGPLLPTIVGIGRKPGGNSPTLK